MLLFPEEHFDSSAVVVEIVVKIGWQLCIICNGKRSRYSDFI